MARIISSKCRQCRQAGEKLFLRGERCYGAKCGMVKRAYPPGAQGKKSSGRRRTVSEFGKQLKEKQRVKIIYGILERQLRKYFEEASAKKGDARENLVRRLEMRLDNVIFRLGFAVSRNAARQLVSHGHILINGKRVNIPSYEVRTGETISLGQRISKSKLTEGLAVSIKKHQPPVWLALDKEKMEAKVLSGPTIDDLGDLAPVGLIIEFYSR